MGKPIPKTKKPTCACDREKTVTDIIESVALEQAALAHIMNAEGEKIQSAVKIATNVEELIDVNESVQATLDAVFRVELALQSKLLLFSDCLCQSCPEPPCPIKIEAEIKNSCPGCDARICKTGTDSFSIEFECGTKRYCTFVVEPTPEGLPISFCPLPCGVTSCGNTFTIDLCAEKSGCFSFTVGVCPCVKVFTVKYCNL